MLISINQQPASIIALAQYILKTYLVIILVFLSSGCSDLNYLSEPDISYKVISDKTSKKDIEILIKRLSEYPPSVFSKIEFNESKREVIFSNGAPDTSIISYFSETPGTFTITDAESSEIWVDNQQVIYSTVSVQESGNLSLEIILSEEGGSIMKAKSLQNMGNMALAQIDGEEILRARIHEELGKRIVIDNINESISDAMKISTLIKYGNLSIPIRLMKLPSTAINQQ